MEDTTSLPGPAQRKLWVRALQMLLMCVAFQLAIWILLAVALLQLVLAAATDHPNDRLRALGAGIGRYLRQIAGFVSFASEQAPFPFSDWPAAP